MLRLWVEWLLLAHVPIREMLQHSRDSLVLYNSAMRERCAIFVKSKFLNRFLGRIYGRT